MVYAKCVLWVSSRGNWDDITSLACRVVHFDEMNELYRRNENRRWSMPFFFFVMNLGKSTDSPVKIY